MVAVAFLVAADGALRVQARSNHDGPRRWRSPSSQKSGQQPASAPLGRSCWTDTDQRLRPILLTTATTIVDFTASRS